MPNPSPSPVRAWKLSLDGWAVLAATIFILLILVGALPRVPW